MRFLAALLFWLVTTVLLAVAIPAIWAQQNVVERGRVRGPGASRGQGSQLQEAMASELSTQIMSAGRRQRLCPQPRLVRGVTSAYTAQFRLSRTVRAGQPHRAPVDVHRLRPVTTRPRRPLAGRHRTDALRRLAAADARQSQPRCAGDADGADHGARVTRYCGPVSCGCCRRGARGSSIGVGVLTGVAALLTLAAARSRGKALAALGVSALLVGRLAGLGWRWRGATSTTRWTTRPAISARSPT